MSSMQVLSLVLFLTQFQGVALADKHWAFQQPKRPEVPVPVSAWAANPIDAFIEAKHRRHHLAPSSPASDATLLRRLSLALRGLPPNLVEQDHYLASGHRNKLERQIDRLLASPAYGERMAQDWLDLARYADTTGHAADMPRTMWLYRDWVITALNADQPYDQFTIEQLAGDLLPAPTESQLIATGFHRNSAQALGNNPRKEEFRVKGIVDRMEVTGQTWLGLTLACAECHDHKHDPISIREYYQLFAIFNNVPHEGEKFNVRGPRMDVKRVIRGELTTLQAQVMAELPQPRATHIHLRGNFEQPGERVSPGLPDLFSHSPKAQTRLDFAQWLVTPKHPLTARVEVNRQWQQLFGVGLVKTADDFGTHGDSATHPNLLDYLAVEFQSHGWSRKRLQRSILASATYRQQSRRRAEDPDPDNRWLSRAGRFRLSAEIIRDQVLAASALLVSEIGGPSVFPPQPEVVGQFRDATAGKWETSEGADRFRRSLYTFWQRMSPHPAITTFDAPSRETCTVTRARTNTPLQALVQWNEPTISKAALALIDQLDRLPAPARVTMLFQRCLGRKPSAHESQRFLNWVQAQSGDRAAWKSLASVLFNLDEFLTLE
jgi:hypothetical protein